MTDPAAENPGPGPSELEERIAALPQVIREHIEGLERDRDEAQRAAHQAGECDCDPPPVLYVDSPELGHVVVAPAETPGPLSLLHVARCARCERRYSRPFRVVPEAPQYQPRGFRP